MLNAQKKRDILMGKQEKWEFPPESSNVDTYDMCYSTAPEILVSSTSYILYISMYREMLTDALLRDRTDLHSAGQCCPLSQVSHSVRAIDILFFSNKIVL